MAGQADLALILGGMCSTPAELGGEEGWGAGGDLNVSQLVDFSPVLKHPAPRSQVKSTPPPPGGWWPCVCGGGGGGGGQGCLGVPPVLS